MISKAGITAQVTDAIREAIVLSDYKPGEKLSEAQLAEYYQVSRTPIREALKQLDREGLVTIIPRVGTCVTKPTLEEINELFELKEMMEGLGAGAFANRITDAEVNVLEKLVHQMETAVAERDFDSYVAANQDFHKSILEGSKNSKLKYFLNLLLNQMPFRSYVHLSIQAPERIEKSLEEHRMILNALKDRNQIEAEQAMKIHVKASGEQLKKEIIKRLFQEE
ncbi:GntR family transcriptional regulator [Shouchella rhizosphaerae]|uniref:GntR family transcriptional regulator n=1 Tax=Shouchella rhizosphaerae TaxID=866786 RepID=UPI003F7DBF4B